MTTAVREREKYLILLLNVTSHVTNKISNLYNVVRAHEKRKGPRFKKVGRVDYHISINSIMFNNVFLCSHEILCTISVRQHE